jgi:hypothetical protein
MFETAATQSPVIGSAVMHERLMSPTATTERWQRVTLEREEASDEVCVALN